MIPPRPLGPGRPLIRRKGPCGRSPTQWTPPWPCVKRGRWSRWQITKALCAQPCKESKAIPTWSTWHRLPESCDRGQGGKRRRDPQRKKKGRGRDEATTDTDAMERGQSAGAISRGRAGTSLQRHGANAFARAACKRHSSSRDPTDDQQTTTCCDEGTPTCSRWRQQRKTAAMRKALATAHDKGADNDHDDNTTGAEDDGGRRSTNTSKANAKPNDGRRWQLRREQRQRRPETMATMTSDGGYGRRAHREGPRRQPLSTTRADDEGGRLRAVLPTT